MKTVQGVHISCRTCGLNYVTPNASEVDDCLKLCKRTRCALREKVNRSYGVKSDPTRAEALQRELSAPGRKI